MLPFEPSPALAHSTSSPAFNVINDSTVPCFVASTFSHSSKQHTSDPLNSRLLSIMSGIDALKKAANSEESNPAAVFTTATATSAISGTLTPPLTQPWKAVTSEINLKRQWAQDTAMLPNDNPNIRLFNEFDTKNNGG